MPDPSPENKLASNESLPTPVAELLEASEKTSLKQEVADEEEILTPVISPEPIVLKKVLSMVEEEEKPSEEKKGEK